MVKVISLPFGGAEAFDGLDIDVVYKRSLDNGETWSALAALNSESSTDSGEDEYPSIGTNGDGRWITVWGGPNNDGGTGSDVFYSISDDNGTTWTAQAELESGVEAFGDWAPVISNDGGDNWLVVWQSTNDLGGTIGSDNDFLYSYSSDNGQTWSSAAAVDSRAVSDGSVTDAWADVAMNSAGKVVLVWTSTNDLSGTIASDTDILVSTSSDFGVSWTTSAALNSNASSDTGADTYAKVALDEDGNSVVVWDSNEDLNSTAGTDTDIFVSRSSDHGASWSAVAPLNSDATGAAASDRYPHIVGDGAGNWVASWSTSTIFNSAISSDNGQTWTTKINVDEGIGSSTFRYMDLIVY